MWRASCRLFPLGTVDGRPSAHSSPPECFRRARAGCAKPTRLDARQSATRDGNLPPAQTGDAPLATGAPPSGATVAAALGCVADQRLVCAPAGSAHHPYHGLSGAGSWSETSGEPGAGTPPAGFWAGRAVQGSGSRPPSTHPTQISCQTSSNNAALIQPLEDFGGFGSHCHGHRIDRAICWDSWLRTR